MAKFYQEPGRDPPMTVLRYALPAAALLAVNTALVGRETRPAAPRGGRLVGDLHVVDEGPRDAPVLVLAHGFAGSARWFDRLAPLLAGSRRVVRVDLLGHGGSAKPGGGYAIEDHARHVAAALDALGVQRATMVGHSFGGAVLVALAEARPDLVERLVVMDEGPDTSKRFASTPLTAELPYVPVLGELLHRVAPDSVVRDGFKDAFAPGFDLAAGFDDPDQVVHDFRAMTFASSKRSWRAESAFLSETPLDERVRRLDLPALVVFGEHDRFFRAGACAEAFGSVPNAAVEVLPGVGHSPPVEAPERVAELIGA